MSVAYARCRGLRSGRGMAPEVQLGSLDAPFPFGQSRNPGISPLAMQVDPHLMQCAPGRCRCANIDSIRSAQGLPWRMLACCCCSC